MNWSSGVVADVPTGDVTVTSTVPELANGSTAVICVEELTVKLVAALLPNATADALVKLVPVTTTVVPPPVGPALGLTDDTLGRL